MKELNEFDHLLEGIDEVEQYEEEHPDQEYDIELIDAKSGVFGVRVRGQITPSSDTPEEHQYDSIDKGDTMPSYVAGQLYKDHWYGCRTEDGKIIIEMLDDLDGKSAGTRSHGE